MFKYNETVLSDGDYVLGDGAAWFKVMTGLKAFAIRIHKTDEGVCVDIYPDRFEDEESIASCYAYDSDLDEEGE